MATPRNIISASLLALGVLGASASAWAFDGQPFAKEAKLSLEQARVTALKQVPGGTIADEELEREPGGSGLRYSFDIKAGKTVHEVGVDAKTGSVLENSVESANAD
ncbi:peptidase propeptide and YPEB domain protein [mine drainage metagenome]|uniref:Peptidase propeptide and YPEB domain protein n=1 Tax=mine drainage metagenome TaxID=410659 RepID=A0A1J5RCU6_9ZZZZ